MRPKSPLTRRACLASLLAAPFAGRAAAQTTPAPSGVLRAAYLATNPAQAVRDVRSGEIRGAAADLAREIARRNNVPVTLTGIRGAAEVIEAVRKGEADIGFVAPNPERMGVVAFTKPYMLVMQSFLVKEGSAIRSVADLDQPGRILGANRGDSIAVYLKTWAKQATLRESPDFTLQEAANWLKDGVVDAFGGGRQRLGAALRGAQGLRLLPDNLYGVPQTIAVAIDKPDLLATLNKTIDELRASGFLKTAIERSGVDGLTVAPE